jgi:hypothetical protein
MLLCAKMNGVIDLLNVPSAIWTEEFWKTQKTNLSRFPQRSPPSSTSTPSKVSAPPQLQPPPVSVSRSPRNSVSMATPPVPVESRPIPSSLEVPPPEETRRPFEELRRPAEETRRPLEVKRAPLLIPKADLTRGRDFFFFL